MTLSLPLKIKDQSISSKNAVNCVIAVVRVLSTLFGHPNYIVI